MLAPYLISLYLNNFTFHMLSTAAAWMAYKFTGSVMSLAVIGLMQFIPILIAFIPSGYTADRFNKRWIIAVTGILNSVVLAGISLSFHLASASISMLYVGVFFYSIVRAFEATASTTILAEIVPFQTFTRSVARSSSVKQVSKVTGPVVAGYLLAWADDTTAVFAALATMSALSCVSALAIRHDGSIYSASKKSNGGYQSLFAGMTLIRDNPLFLGAISLDVLAGLLGGLTGVLPILATEILQADASALGWMRSSIAIGSFGSSLILGTIVLNQNIGRHLVQSVTFLGISMIITALMTNIFGFCLALCVFGVFDALSVHIRQNLIQIASPMAVRGRVTSANQLFVVISNQLSDVRAGVVASLIGVIPTVIFGGIAVVGLGSIWRYRFPKLFQLNSFDDAAAMDFSQANLR